MKNMRGKNKKLWQKDWFESSWHWNIDQMVQHGKSKEDRKNSNKTIEWGHSSSSECNNWSYNGSIDGGANKHVNNT